MDIFKGSDSAEKVLLIEYDPNDQEVEPVPILCGECWLTSGPDNSPKCKCLNKAALCNTDSSVKREYVSAIKSGRAFNGFEKDRGTIVHLVLPMAKNEGGYWGDKALCGVIPGKRSNGWHKSNSSVNCEKCLKKYGHEPTK